MVYQGVLFLNNYFIISFFDYLMPWSSFLANLTVYQFQYYQQHFFLFIENDWTVNFLLCWSETFNIQFLIHPGKFHLLNVEIKIHTFSLGWTFHYDPRYYWPFYLSQLTSFHRFPQETRVVSYHFRQPLSFSSSKTHHIIWRTHYDHLLYNSYTHISSAQDYRNGVAQCRFLFC